MSKKVVRYTECGFLIPKQGNWQHVHKSVFDIAVDGKDVNSNREFIYSVTDHPALDNNLMVTLRTQAKLSASLEMTNEEVAFEVGQPIAIKLDISARKGASNRPSDDEGGKRIRGKCTFVNPIEYETWITNLFKNRGFDVTSVNFFSIEKREVNKGGYEFFIPKVSFLLKGTVTNCEELAKAWMEGVGRSRGYGLGMLELYQDV